MAQIGKLDGGLNLKTETKEDGILKVEFEAVLVLLRHLEHTLIRRSRRARLRRGSLLGVKPR